MKSHISDQVGAIFIPYRIVKRFLPEPSCEAATNKKLRLLRVAYRRKHLGLNILEEWAIFTHQVEEHVAFVFPESPHDGSFRYQNGFKL
ncbi:MAG: hypothetical protein IPN74_19840 [Haliscomenobacter sp.]|nr:hypothetical protein [Haliscomenobacter sp.]